LITQDVHNQNMIVYEILVFFFDKPRDNIWKFITYAYGS